eukprot:1157791-Pelagomonas_calceolata.AAC.4
MAAVKDSADAAIVLNSNLPERCWEEGHKCAGFGNGNDNSMVVYEEETLGGGYPSMQHLVYRVQAPGLHSCATPSLGHKTARTGTPV